ncbi:hypothetical protein D3C77_415220 [compost metagenome]
MWCFAPKRKLKPKGWNRLIGSYWSSRFGKVCLICVKNISGCSFGTMRVWRERTRSGKF